VPRRRKVTAFNVSPTMMRFRKYSIELYMELGVFDQVGSCGWLPAPSS